MGLLSEGRPLSWEETKALAEHVRVHGAKQFIALYQRLKDRKGDVLKWGDEIEYMVLKLDDEKKTVKVSTRAKELLQELQKPELEGQKDLKSLWRPEYASYMVEGTPGIPYGCKIDEFNLVEKNMRSRREEVEQKLKEDEVLVSMSIFPRLGCESFCFPEVRPDPVNSFSKSLFWPNDCTYQGHPRFKTLTSNIRERRGEKVAINVPVYRDTKTPEGYLEDLGVYGDVDGTSQAASKPGHIYMDAMGFGMGLSCLQVTFQACNVDEAENLYDQLAPLCPIFLALTAASPMFRGFLADVDCRWNIISAAVDDRTEEERAEGGISKSRYDSISSYISDCSTKYNYNDLPLEYNEKVYKMLKESGVKELMAKHVSHLFIRDTVSLFSEKVDQNDEIDTDHFENIQSTNWQTMRFKPPPAAPDAATANAPSSIGWRVEFRPCELQFTDFENAAVVCFIVLLTRVILSFNYNLIIPISKVDENMKRAQKRDAVLNQKFFFRTNITTTCQNHKEPQIAEMTVAQIINGDASLNYPGLLPLIHEFLRDQEVGTATMCTLANYWKLIQLRSSGELKTNASFMREFVLKHPDYKNDSKVSDLITYDLIREVSKIRQGKPSDPKLLGNLHAFKN